MTRCLKRRIIHAEMLLLICLKSRGLYHRPQHPPMPPPDSVSHPPSAAPQSSKSTPSPKQPGYKLSRCGFINYRPDDFVLIISILSRRFSLESSLPRSLNVLPTIRRPASLHFDKPTSAAPSSPDSDTPSEHLFHDSMGSIQSHGGGKI